jgi:hypothetical protein
MILSDNREVHASLSCLPVPETAGARAARGQRECQPARRALAAGLAALAALACSACGASSPAGPRPQTIAFGSAPTLLLHGTDTVHAVASSGLAVSFSSASPGVCTVDAATGLVADSSAGTCVIAADQAGNAEFAAAPQVTQHLEVDKLGQAIAFEAAPALALHGTARVSARATSGLAVTYSSATPAVCSVDSATGLVTDIDAGLCTVAAEQAGDADYAPAPRASQSITVVVPQSQTLSFGDPPELRLYGTATVSASASSGLPVTFSSQTPAICSVVATTGVVTDLAEGECIIAADQAGNAQYEPAPQARQTLTVSVSTGPATAPGAPTAVAATLGATPAAVVVTFTGPADSGGSPIVSYTAASSPGGLSATGSGSPITVTCPSSCSGYSFAVFATNGVGDGLASAPVHILTVYDVIETFREPQTQPSDSIFTGSFTLDTTTNEISNLTGSLTESMTGPPMDTVPLLYQLSDVSDGLGGGGRLVTTFHLNTTNTFYPGGFEPAVGVQNGGIYFGFPTAPNPMKGGVGNAYAMIDVNLPDPTVPLTPSQVDLLAYADCTAGGMMGASCMTGTTVAGYGAIGTMDGYPISQTITKR